jgi:hypothetical protein
LSLAVFWRLPSFWRSKPLATFSARCSIAMLGLMLQVRSLQAYSSIW